jgi:hypothetical protein
MVAGAPLNIPANEIPMIAASAAALKRIIFEKLPF